MKPYVNPFAAEDALFAHPIFEGLRALLKYAVVVAIVGGSSVLAVIALYVINDTTKGPSRYQIQQNNNIENSRRNYQEFTAYEDCVRHLNNGRGVSSEAIKTYCPPQPG